MINAKSGKHYAIFLQLLAFNPSEVHLRLVNQPTHKDVHHW